MQKLFIFLTFFAVKILFAQEAEADYIFKNVNIITMKDDKVLQNKTIVIKNGKIIEVSDKTNFKSHKTVNAKGKYLMPSLADAHVHLPENNEELEKVMKLNLINGITKIRSMRGTWDDVNRRTKYIYEKDYYPRLYLSPPPIHRSHEFSLAQLENYVKASKDYGFDFIKVLSIKNQSLLKQLDSLCKKHDVKIAGHFPKNSDGKGFSDELVFSTNYNSFEHLGGLIGNPECYENRIKKIKQHNVFVCPTMQWYAVGYGQYGINEMLNQRGMEYIPKEIKNDWAEKSKNYREKLGKEGFEKERNEYASEMQERLKVTKRLNDEGVKLLLSPDSSSKFIVPGFGILEEMKLYKKTNISNLDILKSATTNFAFLFNGNYGTIEMGKNADFILLSQNPLQNLNALENIEAVFYNKIYLDKKQLNEIAKSVLPK